MRETPPIYLVHITEVTSKKTILNTIFEGKLAPQLRNDSELMERIAESDRRTYWRPGKARRHG